MVAIPGMRLLRSSPDCTPVMSIGDGGATARRHVRADRQTRLLTQSNGIEPAPATARRAAQRVRFRSRRCPAAPVMSADGSGRSDHYATAATARPCGPPGHLTPHQADERSFLIGLIGPTGQASGSSPWIHKEGPTFPQCRCFCSSVKAIATAPATVFGRSDRLQRAPGADTLLRV